VVVVAHHPYSSGRTFARLPLQAVLTAVNHRAALHIAVSGQAAGGEQCRRARRIKVVPLGGEVQPCTPQEIQTARDRIWPSDTRFPLLSLGRLEKFKNLSSLVEAVALIQKVMERQKASLCIVGSGSQQSVLKSMITKLGVSHLVQLVPETHEPSAFYFAADTLIVPSFAEGGPITAVEAALAGTRVHMTNVGLAQELAGLGAQVSLISGFDRHTIAKSLVAILEGEPVSALQRQKWALNAGGWRVDKQCDGFYSLVKSVIEGT